MSFVATAQCRLPRRIAQTAASAILIAGMGATTATQAAEGYLQNGYGARQKALAGSGVADSTDATAISLNPAGLANVGNQATVSISAISQRGGFESTGLGGVTADGHHNSDPGLVVVPNMAANWRVNWGFADAVGFSVYANGGAKTHYSDFVNSNCALVGGTSGAICGGELSLNMQQAYFSAALAKQLLPGLSLGLAPIVVRQTIEVDGVGLFAPFSVDPTQFSNKGTAESWGFGVRGGVEWKVLPTLRVGLAGNAPIHMSRFDAYSGLFAKQGRVDAPGTVQAGMAIDVAPELTFMADYKHIWYKSISAVGNPSTNLTAFGSDLGPGFGLNDVDVVKFGLEWRRSKDLTLRLGYSYNSAPISGRDADLNIMTLGVVQNHFTGGLKYKMTNAMDLEMAAMYAPKTSVSGPELNNPGRNVTTHNSIFEVTVGAVYRFGAETQAAPLK
ncbi:MAG: hydrocarbon degradation protein [Hyphomicrobiaceae bacterium]|nr:hydrocarbon degradation protein [Hyphomicrobiaceae bacterium]